MSHMEKKNCVATACEETTDRLTQLPDEVLCSIMAASFSMKEAARASILSHKWNNLWRCFRVLIFEDLGALDRIYPDLDPESSSFLRWQNVPLCLAHGSYTQNVELLSQERPLFVGWVNHVLDKHLGPFIDELRITYDLDISSQSHFNKWVAFALAKQVKRLELDFTPFIRYGKKDSHEFCSLHKQVPPNQKFALTSLCLRFVNVTSQAVECLLQSCPSLENLCVEFSKQLTSITSPSNLALSLKHLEVLKCQKLDTIDISAPNLLSFRCLGHPVELHIRNASLLSTVSIGEFHSSLSISYAFDSLSMYFSQLENLTLRLALLKARDFGMSNIPAMPNLKHLELCIWARSYHHLAGWIPLFDASPSLQKLTVKFWVLKSAEDATYSALHNEHSALLEASPAHQELISKIWGTRGACDKKNFKRDEGSGVLWSLKTVELVGLLGNQIDLEIASYVFKKAVVLEEVIVDAKPSWLKMQHADCLKPLVVLQEMLPPGVKLIFKPLS